MDENLHIRTSTGVDLSLDLASLGDRILAWLLDALVLVGYIIISQQILTTLSGGEEIIAFRLFFALPAFFYHFYMEVFMNGQTIGKRARDIQVVRLDGMPVTLGNYAMRYLLRLLEISALQGSLAMLFIVGSKYGQRLGDIAAGTTVVKVKRENYMESTLYREVEENYQVKYPQAGLMTNEDAETISLLLLELKKSRNEISLLRLVQQARKNICQRLSIESESNDMDFLNVLMNDYNFIQSKA